MQLNMKNAHMHVKHFNYMQGHHNTPNKVIAWVF